MWQTPTSVSTTCTPVIIYEASPDKGKPTGTSGGAVLDINGELIAVHSGQLWDELGPSMNTAVTINRYGNDLESFTGLLYFMALEEVNRREKGGEEGLIGNDWCPTWSKKLKGGQWARNHGRAYGW